LAHPLSAERLTGPVGLVVFVPGVAAGSPLHEQMVSGARRAAAEYPNLTVKVIEGGFNQAEWEEKVTALAASGEYGSSSPPTWPCPSCAGKWALNGFWSELTPRWR
jgi:simple sugar transport system substrate-binding protein